MTVSDKVRLTTAGDPRIQTIVPSRPQYSTGRSGDLVARLDALERTVAKLRADVSRSMQIIAVRLELLESAAEADNE